MPNDAETLAHALTRVQRRIRQESRHDLTPTQMSVLIGLRKSGPSTPSSVAARERVRPPTITRVLNCLADDGLVTREQDPGDGRQVLITLSDLGQTTLEQEFRRRDVWLDLQVRQLDAQERALLRKATLLLIRIADS